MRGLQMIQPDGYRWKRVFARLDLSKATYAEVYLPSFWQVPGPSAVVRPQLSGPDRPARESQIRRFHRQDLLRIRAPRATVGPVTSIPYGVPTRFRDAPDAGSRPDSLG